MADKTVKKMGIEGAGPKIIAPAILCFIATVVLSYVYRPMFDITFLPRTITLALAALLLVAGITLWLSAVAFFLLAYRKGEMATRGPYALMPNPIYSSWTVFVFPGIALLLNWWLLMVTPLVMYVAFRIFIKEEDNFMQQRYGRRYTEYRERVPLKFL
jgi:protein-S-isoprenylcysteine O-methyltransferase Ste14